MIQSLCSGLPRAHFCALLFLRAFLPPVDAGGISVLPWIRSEQGIYVMIITYGYERRRDDERIFGVKVLAQGNEAFSRADFAPRQNSFIILVAARRQNGVYMAKNNQDETKRQSSARKNAGAALKEEKKPIDKKHLPALQKKSNRRSAKQVKGDAEKKQAVKESPETVKKNKVEETPTEKKKAPSSSSKGSRKNTQVRESSKQNRSGGCPSLASAPPPSTTIHRD